MSTTEERLMSRLKKEKGYRAKNWWQQEMDGCFEQVVLVTGTGPSHNL